jgi:high-affinity nickel permease
MALYMHFSKKKSGGAKLVLLGQCIDFALATIFVLILGLFRQCISFMLMNNFKKLSASKFQNRYDTERCIPHGFVHALQ